MCQEMYDSEAFESVSESLNYSKIIPSYGNPGICTFSIGL